MIYPCIISHMYEMGARQVLDSQYIYVYTTEPQGCNNSPTLQALSRILITDDGSHESPVLDDAKLSALWLPRNISLELQD